MAKPNITNSRPWTEEEVEFLEENYGKLTAKEISERLDRSVSAINTYCNRHGIKSQFFWTDEEIDFLKENYGKLTAKEISEQMNRSLSSIFSFASSNNILAHQWTEEQEEFVEDKYGILTIDQIAKKINKTPKAVYQKKHRMGIGRFYEASDSITIAEASRIINKTPYVIRNWEHKGLKVVRRSRFALIKFETFLKFMKDNPHLWRASECDTNLLEYYPWFHEKLLEERKERDKYA